MDRTSCLATSFRSISLSLFCLLQVQWASWRLSKSDGCPPLAIGMIWSMQAESGCGYLSAKSTGFPQIPHTDCVANIFFLFRSKAPRWEPSLSGLFRFNETPPPVNKIGDHFSVISCLFPFLDDTIISHVRLTFTDIF